MQRPAFYGINHLKLAASDIKKTQAFYEKVLGLQYIPVRLNRRHRTLKHTLTILYFVAKDYDHEAANGALFAIMVKLDHKGQDIIIEIRHNEAQAMAQQGWDPITWGVESRKDLESWKAWFEQEGVKCSKVFSGLKGWVLCALDPDGKMVRIYCDEEHEWTSEFDHDDFWLR